jgi:hypothetical protein
MKGKIKTSASENQKKSQNFIFIFAERASDRQIPWLLRYSARSRSLEHLSVPTAELLSRRGLATLSASLASVADAVSLSVSALPKQVG